MLKEKVREFFDVLAGGDVSALEGLVAEGYMPHCAKLAGVPVLEAGREALRRRLAARGAVPHQVFRIVADGEYVFAQVRYDGVMPVSGADIFRFDAAGRIVEHWNSRQRIPQDFASGVDRFAGGGDADLPVTAARRAEMKAVLTRVLLDMWGKGNAALVPVYYEESYIQHNPDMPGGFFRIKEIMETEIPKYIAATGGDFPVDIHLMGAEGDLIFVYYSIFMAGINRNAGARSTNTDIFRINDANKMIEHWDVLQMESEPLADDVTLF
jgi:predicted SnoaL-like aldol condensation-catalyzing enzyme